MRAFDIDPDFPDRIMGWGVLRVTPWHFVGLFVDAAAARKMRDELGDQYIVRHGTKRVRTDDFQVVSNRRAD